MFKRCIMFLVDGARADVLEDELSQGRLPNLQRYFVGAGSFKTILTAFPSTTGPAYLPYVTGCYPGTCNIPGIRWFDKTSYAARGWSLKSFRSYVGLETLLMSHDMNHEIKTAFQIFERPVGIFSMVNRGLGPGQNLTRHSRIWYYYYAHLTDHWNYVDEASVDRLLTAIKQGFDFAFVVFPSVDEYSHRSSVNHPTTRRAYRSVDTLIGKVMELMERRSLLHDTLLTLVSDHGLSDTHTHFDVGPYIEENGFKTMFYTQIFKRNISAASMVSGNGMAHLYFKGEGGWGKRLGLTELSRKGDILDKLRRHPAVALVAVQEPDGAICLLTGRGKGSFRLSGERIFYEWDIEPLGLDLSAGGQDRRAEFSVDESLNLTFNSYFPDVFNQLSQLFRSPRSGDVILSAAPGFDLRERYEHPEHRASHGSLCPEHMKTPFLINYPIQMSGYHRSVDVFPTILKLMGRDIPAGIDGRSMI